MIYLVTGGSGSGKSGYAEQLMDGFIGEKYYIATMQVYDDEGKEKVERHRKMRLGKGFFTIEQPVHIGRIAIKEKPNALLECMSNLVANEMFMDGKIKESHLVADKIISDVIALSKQVEHLVIVTNNVFEDGVKYDAITMEYLNALGKVNKEVAKVADRVIEVVVGIPVVIKEEVCPY